MIGTLELVIMGVVVAVLVGLVVFAHVRLRALEGGPRREPGEQRPDMVRSTLTWIWPRG